MRDEHNPFRDDVYWPMEKIWKADRAAAQEGRQWEGKRIMGWSMWKAGMYWHAVMVLEDSTRYVIHEESAKY